MNGLGLLAELLVICQIVVFLQITLAQQRGLKQTNLLLIMYDDLRPELSIYGRHHMITPNFERLAAKSVVFDHSYCQVAVCNPSRDSLLTGLRPDTVGSYNFQSSYHPHEILPSYLRKQGYNTAGFGKILHWEPGEDKNIWSFDHWENNWYDYQNKEGDFMNSSTMPDKLLPEENFRDYQFTTRTIEAIRKMHAQKSNYFMAAIGFKLPHLALHVPYKYYDLYRNKSRSDMWKLNKKELRFPASTNSISYRCCADMDFKFMNEEGGKRYDKSVYIGDINTAKPERMHDELMMSYCGAVTYLDTQLGRLLDVVDELQLWNNLTVVLTSDHGMHNGEKGLWEKWSLFDESAHVPLIISHPQSPFQGQHYTKPTESIDVFATLVDILGIPTRKNGKRREIRVPGSAGSVTGGGEVPLQGKSLAPVLFGTLWEDKLNPYPSPYVSKTSGKVKTMLRHRPNVTGSSISTGGGLIPPYYFLNESVPIHEVMPAMIHDFAITQALRCAQKSRVKEEVDKIKAALAANQKVQRSHIWDDCDKFKKDKLNEEICVLGYSMRTSQFRYTGYFYFDRLNAKPQLDVAPYSEELYDHRDEKLSDFTHLETTNLAKKPGYEAILLQNRARLIDFIRKDIKFKGSP